MRIKRHGVTREEFVSLVTVEHETLRRLLTALCLGDTAEADDIAQETMIKAYLSSGSYREQGTFSAWLYKIAHRTFLDHCKNRKEILSIDEARDVVADASCDADSSFRYQSLHYALSQLPPKERSSILLFYMKGYSVKEIAEILDCSADAVKKQLERGRTKLKQILKEKGYGT